MPRLPESYFSYWLFPKSLSIPITVGLCMATYAGTAFAVENNTVTFSKNWAALHDSAVMLPPFSEPEAGQTPLRQARTEISPEWCGPRCVSHFTPQFSRMGFADTADIATKASERPVSDGPKDSQMTEAIALPGIEHQLSSHQPVPLAQVPQPSTPTLAEALPIQWSEAIAQVPVTPSAGSSGLTGTPVPWTPLSPSASAPATPSAIFPEAVNWGVMWIPYGPSAAHPGSPGAGGANYAPPAGYYPVWVPIGPVQPFPTPNAGTSLYGASPTPTSGAPGAVPWFPAPGGNAGYGYSPVAPGFPVIPGSLSATTPQPQAYATQPQAFPIAPGTSLPPTMPQPQAYAVQPQVGSAAQGYYLPPAIPQPQAYAVQSQVGSAAQGYYAFPTGLYPGGQTLPVPTLPTTSPSGGGNLPTPPQSTGLPPVAAASPALPPALPINGNPSSVPIPVVSPTPGPSVFNPPPAPASPNGLTPNAPPLAQPPTTAAPLMPPERNTPLTEPNLDFQGLYVVQGDDSSARARLNGSAFLTPHLFVGGVLDWVTGPDLTNDDGLQLTELYLAGSVPGAPGLRFRFGQLDLTSYFDRNSFSKDIGRDFFNSTLQTNPALFAGANVTASRPAGLVQWAITDDIAVSASVFSSDSDIGEFALDGFAGEVSVRTGNLIVRGTFLSSEDTEFLETGDRLEAYGVNAEWFIPSLNLGVFGRYGRVENDSASFDADTFSVGINALDVFMDDDRLGLAYGRDLEFADDDDTTPDVLEFFYDFKVLPNLRAGFTFQQRNSLSESFAGFRIRSDLDLTPNLFE